MRGGTTRVEARIYFYCARRVKELAPHLSKELNLLKIILLLSHLFTVKFDAVKAAILDMNLWGKVL